MAKDGSDQNPCTLDEPWLTIQHAAESLVAGDTVLDREVPIMNPSILPGAGMREIILYFLPIRMRPRLLTELASLNHRMV